MIDRLGARVRTGKREPRAIVLLVILPIAGFLFCPFSSAEPFSITSEEYILDQGRWSDEAAPLRRAWEQVRDATGADPATAFWTGFRFAQCLDEVGGYSLLFWSKSLERESLRNWETPMEQVTLRCLEWYREMEPEPEAERAAGWLTYWYGRCKCREKSSLAAIEYARKAEVIARNTNDTQLRAWCQILRAQAAYDDGNVLAAYALLDCCRVEYKYDFDANFRASLAIRLARCETELGLHEKARGRALDMAEDLEAHPYLQVRLLYEYGLAEMTRGATEEALAPFAVIRQFIPQAEFWSSNAVNRWGDIFGRVPKPVFLAYLASAVEEGRPIERAALLLERADMLIRDKEVDEGRILIDRAEEVCPDPRVKRKVLIMRTRLDGTGMQTIAERLFREASDDRDLIRYYMEVIKGGLKGMNYDNWLEENRSLVPDDMYRIDQGEWIGWYKGDLTGAVELLRPVLESKDSNADKYRAYQHMIVCQFKLGNIEGAKDMVREFEYAALDDCWRERVVYFAGCYVRGKQIGAAHWLYDRVLATQRQPNWYRCAVVEKTELFLRQKQTDRAIEFLENMVKMRAFREGADGRPMSDAHLLLAEIYEQQFHDFDRAQTHYEIILDGSPEMPKYQCLVFRQYVEFLKRHEKWQEAIEVCRRGLRELPLTHEEGRILLMVDAALCTAQDGKLEALIPELEEIREDTYSKEGRERALEFLRKQGFDDVLFDDALDPTQ